MKLNIPLLVIALTSVANALPHEQSLPRDDVASVLEARQPEADISSSSSEELWKRKGGGGGGGGKGGAGSSSGGSSSGGSSSGGGSSSSGGGGSSRGSGSSSSGGRTTTGSGVQPSYGRGYYGGGSAVPYQSGQRSAGGISPLLFVGAASFAFFPALWLYGVYSYPYSNPYNFRNRTTNRNETKPVNCLCEQYSECGCDENGDNSHLAALIGTGEYPLLNKSVITVADVNGTSTILINGTLPNGTTAAGGTEDPNGTSAAAGLKLSGYWLMIALVGCTVFLN